jgi:hypothetical protein
MPGDKAARATQVTLMRDPWGLGGDAAAGVPWEGDTARTGEHAIVPDGGRGARSRGKGKGKRR